MISDFVPPVYYKASNKYYWRNERGIISNKINTELEGWIISHMVTKSHSNINPGTIIAKAPQQLAVEIPNAQTLVTVLFGLKQKGLIEQELYYDFVLTTDGLLEYRKYIHPLWQISHDKARYENILDKTPGDKKSKESVKKILKSIKDLTIDQAYDILINYLKQAGNESVYFIIRILSELTNSGQSLP